MRFGFRRKKAETGPYPGRPNPHPVRGGPWVRVASGINITDRVTPEYARWVVSKIQEAAPFDTFRVLDSNGRDVTEEYR